MINKLRNNETVNLYDDGAELRDIMHIKDVCLAIDLICNRGQYDQIYNISSGYSTSIRDIILKAKDKMNSSSDILSSDSSSFHKLIQTKNIFMDNSKIRSLGFEQKYFLDDILDEICFTG